jgi:hypothetical protein
LGDAGPSGWHVQGYGSRRHDDRSQAILTRSFRALVQKRVARDPAFGVAPLRDRIDVMLAGNADAGKAIFARHYQGDGRF